MDNWMRQLNNHYREERARHPRDNLLVVFDIDGTIIDMRHVIRYILRRIDRAHGTSHFGHLRAEDIKMHEEDMELFLDQMGITRREKRRILSSYRRDLWASTAVMEAHKPFEGVFEVIRWFQLQERTFVGLNTGRPESLRFNTHLSLNRLGEAHSVRFKHELLYMKPEGWEGDIPEAKARGLDVFRSMGYRPIAMIDNEPENLETIALSDAGRGVLLLHADTIFRSRLTLPPWQVVSGRSYDINAFVDNTGMRRSA